jgi:hypothetical protein
LKYIFLDDLEILEERPFKFEVLLNASSESNEKNFFKMKMIFELPEDYPHSIPIIRIRNLTQDIVDNNMLMAFEKIVAEKAIESVGTQMIYDICESLRE